MKYLWILFFFLVSSVSLASNNIGYLTDLDEALRLSKQTKQQVLLIFSASWCNYCQSLKNDLQELPNLESKIICIIDTDSNKKLTRQFKSKTLPTSILMDSDGQEISRLSGYKKFTYISWLSER